MITLRPSRFALAILFGITAAVPAAWGGQSPPAVPPGGAAAGSPAPADPVQECLAGLKAANVQFRALGAVTKDGCAVEGAVELNAVPSLFGTVSAPAKPTLAYMGSGLTAIGTGPGFVCRNRYDKPGEKISEHAKGDAVDVMAFALEDGQKLSVRNSSASDKIDGALMKTLQTTLCGYFTTILGPGSNDAHKEHFHFDMGLHGASANYCICE